MAITRASIPMQIARPPIKKVKKTKRTVKKGK